MTIKLPRAAVLRQDLRTTASKGFWAEFGVTQEQPTQVAWEWRIYSAERGQVTAQDEEKEGTYSRKELRISPARTHFDSSNQESSSSVINRPPPTNIRPTRIWNSLRKLSHAAVSIGPRLCWLCTARIVNLEASEDELEVNGALEESLVCSWYVVVCI